MSIGKRVVEIVIKGHDASVAAFKSLQANATESKKKLKELSDEIPGLSRAVSLVTNPLVAATAAIVGLATAAFKAAKANVELGASFQDMSNRTELSVESLAKWKYIAEQNGAVIGDFEMSFRKLRQTMADATAGDEAAIKVFQTLGVSATDSSGKMRDLETVMLEIGQSVRQYGVASVQGAAAQDALGRGSSALVAIIKQQSGALKEQSTEASIYSSNMTTAWAESADAADDAAKRAKIAGDNIRAGLMPAAAPIIDFWTELKMKMFDADGWVQLEQWNAKAGERAAKSLAEGYAAGLVNMPTAGASSDNSAKLAEARLGDEKANIDAIAARIKRETEAAAQLALVAWAAANEPVPLPLVAMPVVTVLPPQAPIKLIGNDALYAEAMSLDLDAELNTGLNDERIAGILEQTDAQNQATDALAAFNEEQQIAQDLALDLKSGFQQAGSAALAAFMSGEAGAADLGNAIRVMVTQVIAEAIVKFAALKLITGIGGLLFEEGGKVPGLAHGGTIPRAAYGYSVPDGPRGMDSRLIAAMPGEEVINRHLSQRLDRMVSAYEYGAAVSPMSVSNSGGRGSIVMQFNVGRPVSVLDGLAYGRTAAEASRKYQEAAL